ncbi:MAG: sulfotransferase family 2 domain-containing protein [Paracoccus sp. (in: a-proteobacteria)]|uniref:sulfotransferase family 2 domain-containing protein n=1 Tax=Paracoccus sp. TaxID=267 RepID=UPI0039E673E0
MALILPSQRIAYFPVPKVACTSIKSMFFEIENGRPFQPLRRFGQMFHIHNFYGTQPFARQDLKGVADFWRFAVYRDPVARFLSCYSNRVLHFRELSAQMLSPAAQKAGALPDPDLDSFVERIELYREFSPSIRHHVAPQVSFLGRDPGYFQQIYTMAELPQMVAELSQRIGRSLRLPHEQRGGPKLTPADLSANAQERLAQIYRADFRWAEKAGIGPAGLGSA